MFHSRHIDHSKLFADEQVTPEERDRRMREIFRRLPPYYARLLDVQSLGLHRYCLEVSLPWKPVRPLYRVYFRYLVPLLGRWITKIPEIFDYMKASILEFPDKNACKQLLEKMGFTDVYFRCLTLGIVCIHVGTKPLTDKDTHKKS